MAHNTTVRGTQGTQNKHAVRTYISPQLPSQPHLGGLLQSGLPKHLDVHPRDGQNGRATERSGRNSPVGLRDGSRTLAA